jgi:NAD+ synthase (glutamine-hydrolysing)
MKTYIAQLNPIVGDIQGNQRKILTAIASAKQHLCDLIITPELALTGYPPEDLLLLPHFIKAAEEALPAIIDASCGIAAIIGSIRHNPQPKGKPLFNSAAICLNGKLIGYQDKMLLPTYDVFDERRYFEPATENKPWNLGAFQIGITLCEDIWQHAGSLKDISYPIDPVELLKRQPLDAMVNLSASPFSMGKFFSRLHVCEKTAKTLKCPILFCNQIGGNDSLIFDGYSFALTAEGKLSHIAQGFAEDFLIIDSDIHPLATPPQAPLEDLYKALVLGIRDYFNKLGFQKACIGLSGGIDSALVACLAQEALGSENILGVAMPSRYSSESSLIDAKALAKNLNIPLKIIPIEKPFQSYLELLTPEFNGKAADTTEENLQARIRGMILMALSNKLGHIVLSTGNKSELALGYATLYGDLCGGLAVISDLTKEQVYTLANHINHKNPLIPQSSLDKPPSAELKLNQKDSDSLPAYSIVDTVLKDYIENSYSPEKIAADHKYDLATVQNLIERIHQNEYKRRQSPLGLRVTEKAFSIGRKFPIVQKFRPT